MRYAIYAVLTLTIFAFYSPAHAEDIVNCNYSGTSAWDPNKTVSGHVVVQSSNGTYQMIMTDQDGDILPMAGSATLNSTPINNQQDIEKYQYTLGDTLSGLQASDVQKLEVYSQATAGSTTKGIPFFVYQFVNANGKVQRTIFFSLGGPFICK